MSEARDGKIIELVEFTLSPEGTQSLETHFALLRQTLLSYDGGISARMLREHDQAGRYIMILEWRDQAAKNAYTADAGVARWFTTLQPTILKHQDRYFAEPLPAAE